MVYYFNCMRDEIKTTINVTNGRIENGIVYIAAIPSYTTYSAQLLV